MGLIFILLHGFKNIATRRSSQFVVVLWAESHTVAIGNMLSGDIVMINNIGIFSKETEKEILMFVNVCVCASV